MNNCCRHPNALTGPDARHARGFTLVELMIVVSISAILAAIAMPQYSKYIGARAIDAQVSALASALRLARSEALKRSIPVTVCPSSNPEAAVPQCSQPSPTLGWATGWIIFTDLGVRGQIGGSDTVIRVQPSFSNSGGMFSTLQGGNASFITYSANGIAIGFQGRFELKNKASPQDSSSSRFVCVSNTGSTRLSKTTCTG